MSKKTVWVEVVSGCEGNCICISDAGGSGRRICGPKPWGGGHTLEKWEVDVEDIYTAIKQAVKEQSNE